MFNSHKQYVLSICYMSDTLLNNLYCLVYLLNIYEINEVDIIIISFSCNFPKFAFYLWRSTSGTEKKYSFYIRV